MNTSELLAFVPTVLFVAVSAFAAWLVSRTGRGTDAPCPARGQRDDPQCRSPTDASWNIFDTPGVAMERDQPPAQEREAF